MKRKTLMLSLSVIVVLLAAAFWAGIASAVDSCFTDTGGHWAEDFICWLKTNSLSSGYPDGTFRPSNNITRAEAAVLLKNQAEIPPSTGMFFLNVGPSDWYLNNNFSNLVQYFYLSSVSFGKTVVGESEMNAAPAFLAGIYGRNMALRKMEFCYEVVSANGYLNKVTLSVMEMSTSGSSSTVAAQVVDDTDRTDIACRDYLLATPQLLDENHLISIQVNAWNSANGVSVKIGRTTLIFEPRTTKTNLTP